MGEAALRVLKVAVIAMGVLIIAAVITLAVLIMKRASPATVGLAPVVLNEPSGTGISGATLSGDRMVVLLHGGGPDRLIILDVASGRVLSHVRVQ